MSGNTALYTARPWLIGQGPRELAATDWATQRGTPRRVNSLQRVARLRHPHQPERANPYATVNVDPRSYESALREALNLAPDHGGAYLVP